MKKLIFAISVLLLSSCGSDKSNTPDDSYFNPKRKYSNMDCVNTTANYAAVLYIDGEPFNKVFDGVSYAWSGGWPLLPGSSANMKIYASVAPIDIKVELHEMVNSTQCKAEVYKTFTRSAYKFTVQNDYRLSVSDNSCTIEAIPWSD